LNTKIDLFLCQEKNDLRLHEILYVKFSEVQG